MTRSQYTDPRVYITGKWMQQHWGPPLWPPMCIHVPILGTCVPTGPGDPDVPLPVLIPLLHSIQLNVLIMMLVAACGLYVARESKDEEMIARGLITTMLSTLYHSTSLP